MVTARCMPEETLEKGLPSKQPGLQRSGAEGGRPLHGEISGLRLGESLQHPAFEFQPLNQLNPYPKSSWGLGLVFVAPKEQATFG